MVEAAERSCWIVWGNICEFFGFVLRFCFGLKGSRGADDVVLGGRFRYKGMGMSNVMDHHQQQQQHHLHAQGGQRKVSLGMSPQSTGGYTSSSMRSAGGVGAAVDGGAGSGSGALMSVLLSWHEKLVELVGVGGIVRVMSDRRTV